MGRYGSYGILLNVIGCVACGYLAKKKGKQPLLYAILGFILPVIGIIVVLVMKPAQVDNTIETDFQIKPDEEPAQEEPDQEDPFHSDAHGAPYAAQPLPSAPAAPAPKFCPYCGQKLDDGAKFCTNCGAPAGK